MLIGQVYAQEACVASEGCEQHAAPRHQYMESHCCARATGDHLGQPQVVTHTCAQELPISRQLLQPSCVRQLHTVLNGPALHLLTSPVPPTNQALRDYTDEIQP